MQPTAFSRSPVMSGTPRAPGMSGTPRAPGMSGTPRSPGTPMYSHRNFTARRLAAAKERLGLSASLCIPARNEEATIGTIVASTRRRLVESVPLLDEILVLDDGSTDGTAAAARDAGARVVAGASVLPEAGPGSGKGDAIWKSLAASSGDLVCWVDGDISDFGPRFVVGLLGPLLTRPEVSFVKGFYHRPGGGATTGGGRVTELAARPLLSLLFPSLAAIIQPLAGEYAGRRTLLESLPITQGWGVDLALILDVAATAGLPALAQVDLGTRRHRHRPLGELAPQAMAVAVAALRRAGVPEREALHLVRFDGDHQRLEVAVETRERPPLASLQEPADELSA
ncbi:MAG: glucosyl-3-phosphoglycerate synthase [Actinomycetota bacterium]|nr:glucosyl-3-phosphoglycerate synthase [Actinomycetota bacterium]